MKRLFFCLLFLFGFGGWVFAGIVEWDAGAGTSYWDDADNWSTNNVPQDGDTVVINVDSNTSVLYNTFSGDVFQDVYANTSSNDSDVFNGMLWWQISDTLKVKETLYIGGNGSVSVNYNAGLYGGSKELSAKEVRIGGKKGVNAKLTVNKSVLRADDLYVGGYGKSLVECRGYVGVKNLLVGEDDPSEITATYSEKSGGLTSASNLIVLPSGRFLIDNGAYLGIGSSGAAYIRGKFFLMNGKIYADGNVLGEYIGSGYKDDPGVIWQYGGINRVRRLFVGVRPDGKARGYGSYYFEGGQLVPWFYLNIGNASAEGTFYHRADTPVFIKYLLIGAGVDGVGTYEMEKGVVSSTVIRIGNTLSSKGYFFQKGGRISFNSLIVALGENSIGSYQLFDGESVALTNYSICIGRKGNGSFSQFGGRVYWKQADSVFFGYGEKGVAEANIYDGVFEVRRLNLVGNDMGQSTFHQYGGKVYVSDRLVLNKGLYSLEGGQLVGRNVRIGDNSTLDFISGSITLSGSVAVGNAYGVSSNSVLKVGKGMNLSAHGGIRVNKGGRLISSGQLSAGSFGFIVYGGRLSAEGKIFSSDTFYLSYDADLMIGKENNTSSLRILSKKAYLLGDLFFEIGGYDRGTSYDFLSVILNSYNVVYLGSSSELWIDLINGFVPKVGDSFFDIMLINSGYTGRFRKVHFPNIPYCNWWVEYNSHSVRVWVHSDAPPSTVPEPSSYILFLLTVGGCVLIRKKKIS